jgi:hypothetical protein
MGYQTVALEREMEVFRRVLPALLGNAETRGRYALIGGDPPELVGTHATDDEAITAGYERFGLSATFLVKLIAEPEAPKYFSRNVRPCPT